MESIFLTINGQKVACLSGDSILIAAEKNSIPILCYHPDLKPHGACRLCLVENEKTGRLMASCVTPAAQDMVIQTASPPGPASSQKYRSSDDGRASGVLHCLQQGQPL